MSFDELTKPPYNKGLHFTRLKDVENREIEDGDYCNWETLISKRGAELEAFYVQMLRSLSTEKGMPGQIFTRIQNKIQDPAKLLRVINMIDLSWKRDCGQYPPFVPDEYVPAQYRRD